MIVKQWETEVHRLDRNQRKETYWAREPDEYILIRPGKRSSGDLFEDCWPPGFLGVFGPIFDTSPRQNRKHHVLAAGIASFFIFSLFLNLHFFKKTNLWFLPPKTDSPGDLVAIQQKVVKNYAVAATFWGQFRFRYLSGIFHFFFPILQFCL